MLRIQQTRARTIRSQYVVLRANSALSDALPLRGGGSGSVDVQEHVVVSPSEPSIIDVTPAPTLTAPPPAAGPVVAESWPAHRTSPIVGVRFTAVDSCGVFSQYVGRFPADFPGHALGQAEECAAWLCRSRDLQRASKVEAFVTHSLTLHDGLEVFAATDSRQSPAL